MKIVAELTVDEFIQEMQTQDDQGKHGYWKKHQPESEKKRPSADWCRIACWAAEKSWAYTKTGERPFIILKDVPLEFIELGHEIDELNYVERYSKLITRFPPLYVNLSLSRFKKLTKFSRPLLLINGNHRIRAAMLKGDLSIDCILSRESFYFFNQFLDKLHPLS